MSELSMQEQVARQYELVAHLSKSLMEIHSALAPPLRAGSLDYILKSSGERSARLMEILGDILNEMDAVLEEDAWSAPIFEAAHQMFPRATPFRTS